MDNIIRQQSEQIQNVRAQSKTSQWLLLNSLLWAGLGFILVGLLSIGYSALIKSLMSQATLNSDAYMISSILVLFAFMILSFFINMKWASNVTQASWGLVVFVWLVDVILLTGMIAPLVTLIDDPQLVFIVIAASGGIFALVGALGYCFMNTKLAMSLVKMVWFIIIGLFLFQLIFMLTFAFVYTNSFSWFYLLFDICYLIVSIAMVALTFFSISKSGEIYRDVANKQEKTKLGLYFGLQLLISFVIMFTYLLRIIARLKG